MNRHTLRETPGIHQSRRETKKEHAIGAILGAEFCDRHIKRSLADRVHTRGVDVELGDQVDVCVPAGDGDDLLGGAAEDQRGEEVEEMDLGDGVGFEVCEHFLLQGDWVFASIYR